MAAQKDRAAFEAIFNTYYTRIYNYALRRTGNIELTKDVAAETFSKAFTNIERYKWKGVSLSSWLYRIATNEINQNYRKVKRISPLNDVLSEQLQDGTHADGALLNSEEMAMQHKKFQQMHRALSHLKPKYQTVLTLRYFEEKSIKEIAEILTLSQNTVKTHIRRGLIKLRACL